MRLLCFGVGSICLIVEDAICSYFVQAQALTYRQLGIALIARAAFLLGSVSCIRLRPSLGKPLLLGSIALAFIVFALPERSTAALAVVFALSATTFVALVYEPHTDSKVHVTFWAILAAALSVIAILLVVKRAVWLPVGPLATLVVVAAFWRHASRRQSLR